MTDLARCSSTAHASPESVQDIDALDRYEDELWQAKLPIATPVDPPALQLVWLTAGFSVTADRAAVGDYLCALQPLEIARRAHLCDRAARAALNELIDVGLLQPVDPQRERISPEG